MDKNKKLRNILRKEFKINILLWLLLFSIGALSMIIWIAAFSRIKFLLPYIN